MRKLSFWEFSVLLVKSFFSRVSRNIIGGLSDFLRRKLRRGKGRLVNRSRNQSSRNFRCSGGRGPMETSQTLNSESFPKTSSGGGWKWSTECRSPQQQVNNLNYHPTVCLTFMIPFFSSPKVPFYELSLFAPRERGAETSMGDRSWKCQFNFKGKRENCSLWCFYLLLLVPSFVCVFPSWGWLGTLNSRRWNWIFLRGNAWTAISVEFIKEARQGSLKHYHNN